MNAPAPTLSPDQADAWDALTETFGAAGIDLISEEVQPPQPGKGRVMAVIGKGEQVIALDVKGKPWSTEQLAENLAGWKMSGDNFCLLIGGPDGLAPAMLQLASIKWSLSPLTLPHPLVRIVLIEQLYRASSILQNHPYHK